MQLELCQDIWFQKTRIPALLRGVCLHDHIRLACDRRTALADLDCEVGGGQIGPRRLRRREGTGREGYSPQSTRATGKRRELPQRGPGLRP